MKYAKVLNDKHIYTKTKHLTLIKDELYTITELKKLRRDFGIGQDEYIIVDIPKSQTYWFCGARKKKISEGKVK